jgi:uncharacterized protein (DUF3084 family)
MVFHCRRYNTASRDSIIENMQTNAKAYGLILSFTVVSGTTLNFILSSHINPIYQEQKLLRQDMKEIRQDVKIVYQDVNNVRQDVNNVRQEMHQEMKEMRQEMHQEMKGMRQEMKGVRQEMTQNQKK